eukprot:2608314-Prymnesium_polylepis.1
MAVCAEEDSRDLHWRLSTWTTCCPVPHARVFDDWLNCHQRQHSAQSPLATNGPRANPPSERSEPSPWDVQQHVPPPRPRKAVRRARR